MGCAQLGASPRPGPSQPPVSLPLPGAVSSCGAGLCSGQRLPLPPCPANSSCAVSLGWQLLPHSGSLGPLCVPSLHCGLDPRGSELGRSPGSLCLLPSHGDHLRPLVASALRSVISWILPGFWLFQVGCLGLLPHPQLTLSFSTQPLSLEMRLKRKGVAVISGITDVCGRGGVREAEVSGQQWPVSRG